LLIAHSASWFIGWLVGRRLGRWLWK